MAIGPEYRRVSFVRRFRLTVRKWLYFQREIADLGPRYYSCSIGGSVDCTGTKADPRRGCPKCEYTIKYRHFEKDCEAAFRRGTKEPQDNRDWPLKHVLSFVGTVIRASGQTKLGYHPRWSILTTRLVDVYRDEVSRMKSIDSWNHTQEMRSLLKEMQSKRGSDEFGDE